MSVLALSCLIEKPPQVTSVNNAEPSLVNRKFEFGSVLLDVVSNLNATSQERKNLDVLERGVTSIVRPPTSVQVVPDIVGLLDSKDDEIVHEAILALAAILFAFSTMIAWSYYGLKSWCYLFGYSNLSENIFVIKNPPREDVISAYGESEFLVMPSQWELSPLVPLESFAFSRPVISTNSHAVA